MRIGLLLLLLPAVCFAQAESSRLSFVCANRHSSPWHAGSQHLSGTPPNYSDVRKRDTAETTWFLDLDSPVCMTQDASDPELNPSQKNVHMVQLALDQAAYERYKALLGRRVVATGSCFGAHTAHHHTPVLLTASNLEQAHSK
jgi:hypothetical protein